jgi:hypothetical protein
VQVEGLKKELALQEERLQKEVALQEERLQKEVALQEERRQKEVALLQKEVVVLEARLKGQQAEEKAENAVRLLNYVTSSAYKDLRDYVEVQTTLGQRGQEGPSDGRGEP